MNIPDVRATQLSRRLLSSLAASLFAANGIGFEQEYADRIFQLFQRLHGKTGYAGTGIGLAICKSIANNHKGYITAQGTPGKGASFTIYLKQ
ncbi:sensor histidine kinase [Deminuibacter soli]|uniref:histidine kinase n=1 Tax=Deminuibacter soli TaxID=2291815 RepID=A0A3E1NRP2_9BACT|nr:ATP-binding protein [Deminuibacter soli]RFM30609.1 hypothetical protein DXN05_02365 [Deminuibacter soli]